MISKLSKIILRIDNAHFLAGISEAILVSENNLMKESSLFQHFTDAATIAPAPVSYMPSYLKENRKQKKEASKMKTKKRMPLFYTAPIFKPKKHDFF